MDRLTELARERESLRAQLEKVEMEMRRELGAASAPAPKSRPAPSRSPASQTTQPRRPATQPPQQREETTPRPTPQAEAEESATATATSTPRANGEGEGRQPSLKDVILNQILAHSRHGMELKEIVAEVTRMVQNGKYKTKAKKVTPIVSQALHHLKQERLVSVHKSSTPPHRNLYSLGETA
jgi:hypothetical protein